jgi:hypothetical protein
MISCPQGEDLWSFSPLLLVYGGMLTFAGLDTDTELGSSGMILT